MKTMAAILCQRGVTLLELMVILVVIAILTAIAIPTYDTFVQRTRRSEAREALADLAARQEQFFLDNKTYAASAGDLGRATTTANGYFVMSIPSASTTAYTLTASAQGTQTKDTGCTAITLTSLNAKTPVDCW
jgi:type IV pilus assembly protein PilE